MRKTAVKTPKDDQQIAFVTPKPAVFGTPKRGVFSTPKRGGFNTPKRGVFCTPKSGAATSKLLTHLPCKSDCRTNEH